MSLSVYPGTIRGLTYNVMKTPEFSTLVQMAASNVSTRIVQSQNPIWHWELIYNYIYDAIGTIGVGLSYTDFRILLGFYLSQQGQFGEFLFDDPTDDYVGPAMLPGGDGPNLQAQLQVVTDGVTYYSPIQRNFGGLFYEDVTDLDVGGIAVYANGLFIPAFGNYTLLGPGLAIPGASFSGLYLRWVAPPATPVTAQFNFLFRVRFESDKVQFEQFMNDLWTLGGTYASGSSALQIVSSRVPAA